MPDTPRFFRYAVLTAMLPVAVLGVVTTPNEYRAIGIEAADLVFHLTILLADRGLGWDAVAAEIARRHGTSGHAEKAARPQ